MTSMSDLSKLETEYLNNVKALPALDRLVYWIKERESIRIKRSNGLSKPWTNDPILRRFRFCCVCRIEDKVSQWLLHNWYLPNKTHPNILVAIVLARHFNLPSTLEAIGFPYEFNPAHIKKVVRARQKQGITCYNGAYMVRGIETADKVEMIVDHVAKPIHNNPPELDCTKMRRCVEALLPYWGLSSFMAGQVIADLRWAWNYRGYWKDRLSYAPVGPGSKRGMNRLFERPIKFNLKQEQFDSELRWLRNKLSTEPTISQVFKRMEAMDLQSCCCEYDKMERTIRGEGKPKQLYKGVA